MRSSKNLVKEKVKKTPLVSVVIPVYNEEKYLSFCLSSILDQSYKKVEVIVVDDGSIDKSIKIAKKYKVKILYQKHLGTARARNWGAKAAKGKILIFVDGDMRFDNKYIENLIEPILKRKSIGTFVKEELVANPENMWSQCWSINNGLPVTRRLPQNYPETDVVFRAILKDEFQKAGGYDQSMGYGEDHSLSKELGKKAINAQKAVCYHYNPSTLIEVFYSARWIGRGEIYKPTLKNFYIHFPIKSIINSMRLVIKGAPVAMVIFKLVYDTGLLVGLFMNNGLKVK